MFRRIYIGEYPTNPFLDIEWEPNNDNNSNFVGYWTRCIWL